MGILSSIHEWVKYHLVDRMPDGTPYFDPYAAFRSYEAYPYVVYAFFLAIIGLIVVLVVEAVKNGKLKRMVYLKYPDYKAMLKEEGRRENFELVLLYLSLISTITFVWAIRKMSIDASFYSIVSIVSLIASLVFIGVYFIYKRCKEKQDRY